MFSRCIYTPSVTFGRRKCWCPEWNPLSEKSLPVVSPAAAASTVTGSDEELQGEVLYVVCGSERDKFAGGNTFTLYRRHRA